MLTAPNNAHPFSDTTADEASEWLTLLMSGEATDEDRQRWQQWRRRNPDNERAWQHIENFAARLKGLHPAAAHSALSLAADRTVAPGRRRAMRALFWLGTAGATGVLASRTQTWRQTVADYRTGTGEQRSVSLDDGTRITLNTASAIDVRFDGERRLVRLLAGEVMIVTGHARSDSRPFVVDTAEGRIRALGTRFSVRQQSGRTRVAVLESAVEITPSATPGAPRLLHAGERTTFTAADINALAVVDDQTSAWTLGQLIADDMRLGDFIEELGRYRPGIVRCDPAVASLRFSGVFPLADTDRILAMLPSVLPVQVRTRTKLWATVESAK
ncbi:FecR domain-containing protein [Variovorax sp. E3]|uniref:FecR domain-containing protein n=1 Tax=Variovorax sp. E3 TaxID=1914993 RepID=UPI0018DE0527|nr:FecR domain-containing protein [Variovorax sp. E3]